MMEGLDAPGLGERRREIVESLKWEGPSGVADLAERVSLNVETVREHLGTLEAMALVARVGTRSSGPGRPEVLYGLTDEAGRLFPSREAEVLKFVAGHLARTGNAGILREAFDAYIRKHRTAAERRLEGLEGRDRVEAAVEVLTEMGFMAELDDEGTSLTLCHCPLGELVEVSRIPCRAEISLVGELLGERPERTSWMPDGDRTCSYRFSGETCATPTSESDG